MTLDLTISLGNIITAFLIMASVIGGYYGMRGQIDLLRQELKTLNDKATDFDSEIKEVRTGMRDVIRQDERMKALEVAVSELRILVMEFFHGRNPTENPVSRRRK